MDNTAKEKERCSNDEIKQMFRNKLEIVLKIDDTNVYDNKESDVSNATTVHDPASVSNQLKNISQYTLDNVDSSNKERGTDGGTDNLQSYRGSSFVLVSGFPFNMSVLYVEWLQEFGKSNSETALVQSVCTGMFMTGGFFSGTLVTKYGPRKCGIIGGFLSTLGIGLAFIASSIVYLVLFIGLITGSGFSLCYISASTVVGMHFKGKQKILALAFVSFGSGIGGSLFPVILEILISRFGWRGSLLIIAGLMLHLVAIGISYTVPLKYNRSRRNSIARRSNIINEDNSVTLPRYDVTSKESQTYNQKGSGMKSDQTNSNIKILGSDENKPNQTAVSSSDQRRRSLYEFSKLRRRSLYEVEEDDDLNQTFASIFKDIITNKLFMGYAFSIAITCMFGIGMGGMVTVMAVSIVKLIGQTNYSAGLGVSMTIVGIFNTAAGPLSGYLRDISGNYNTSFICLSVVLFLASVSFFATMVCRYYHIHDRGSRFDFEFIITKKSRRTSLVPWRRKSVTISSVHL
ncbi:SLC16A14 [Mytilus edulis]|uniref:SLC16A14 n=1 Tax=Mytilus edulis TaxID=6550 RepID=A0A8S3TB43_MYTED|nr:SLC16A14 [Mytilus edulis]